MQSAPSGAGAARPVRVALVSDERLLSETLAAALAVTGVLEVAAIDPRGGDVAAHCHELGVEVVIVDPQAPGVGGDALLPLLTALDGCRVLLLAKHGEGDLTPQAIRRGVAGAVSLTSSVEEIRQTLLDVRGGHVVLTAQQLRVLAARSPAADAPADPAAALTRREREILRRLVSGRTTTDIATDLGITVNTARTHIQNLLGKLGLHSRVEAVAWAVRHGVA